MTAILITPPAIEPLSLAEAKLWLRLDGTDEDATVAALIAAARLAVELASGRKLIAQGWRIMLDAWPADATIRLPLSPVRAVTAVRVRDGAGLATELSSAVWTADVNRDPALIHLRAPPLQPGLVTGGIEIDVDCGFGNDAEAVPEPLRQAIRVLVARWFENRGDAALPQLPPEFVSLCAAWRRPRL